MLQVLCTFFGVSQPGLLYGQEKSLTPVGRQLLLNVDDCGFFGIPADLKANSGAWFDRCVDTMADNGVTVLLCCINARRTNYSSKVWDSFWDGFDPAGSDDQPFLAGLPQEQRAAWRNHVNNIRTVAEQGVDYPAHIIARCRYRGISPWISLRMNDCHHNDIPNHPFHGTFWAKNPQFFRKNNPGYFATCLDYAHPEVRDFFKSLIVEALDRFDPDGIELDFMREAYLFSAGEESAGREILNSWMREIHAIVCAAAEKRGHAIRLGVRVPSRPETAFGLGLDAITWAKEGLIDMLVVTPRYTTLEFDLPIEHWRNSLGDAKVTLVGGLEILYRPCPGGPASPVTPELARGAATAVLGRGADAVYLFNYYSVPEKWSKLDYTKTLHAMGSLDTLLQESRTFGITFRDVTAPDEKYRAPLPAEGNEIVLPMWIGPIPSEACQCELSVEFAPLKGQPLTAATISVDETIYDACRNTALGNGRQRTTINVPITALANAEIHKIKIVAKDEPASYQVKCVEVTLCRPTK